MASSVVSRTDGNLPRHVQVAHMRERHQDGGKPVQPARPGFDPPACLSEEMGQRTLSVARNEALFPACKEKRAPGRQKSPSETRGDLPLDSSLRHLELEGEHYATYSWEGSQ